MKIRDDDVVVSSDNLILDRTLQGTASVWRSCAKNLKTISSNVELEANIIRRKPRDRRHYKLRNNPQITKVLKQ